MTEGRAWFGWPMPLCTRWVTEDRARSCEQCDDIHWDCDLCPLVIYQDCDLCPL